MTDSQPPKRIKLYPYVTPDGRILAYDYNRAATERLLERPPVDPSLIPVDGDDDDW